MSGPCAYQLLIRLAVPVTITVGGLGRHDFPAGWYVYTGSAKRNIDARVRRHLSRAKRLHWHIDYLLAAPEAQVAHTTLHHTEECRLNARTPGCVPVSGFGAGDCRAGCGGHLKYLGRSREIPAQFRSIAWMG